MTDDTPDTDSDDLEGVADRLEAALDRIVRNLENPGPAATGSTAAELAARLDGLIVRLREALSRTAEPK